MVDHSTGKFPVIGDSEVQRGVYFGLVFGVCHLSPSDIDFRYLLVCLFLILIS